MDKFLRSIIKISQGSVAFTAFDDLFQRWLARAQNSGICEVVRPQHFTAIGPSHQYYRRYLLFRVSSLEKTEASGTVWYSRVAAVWESWRPSRTSTHCTS